jgi:hypothetical protein
MALNFQISHSANAFIRLTDNRRNINPAFNGLFNPGQIRQIPLGQMPFWPRRNQFVCDDEKLWRRQFKKAGLSCYLHAHKRMDMQRCIEREGGAPRRLEIKVLARV